MCLEYHTEALSYFRSDTGEPNRFLVIVCIPFLLGYSSRVLCGFLGFDFEDVKFFPEESDLNSSMHKQSL